MQVNSLIKGVDFGIQVNACGLHLMQKYGETQVEVDISESNTQAEEIFICEIIANTEEETEAATSP